MICKIRGSLILFRRVDERFLYCLDFKWASLFKTASLSFMNLESFLTEIYFFIPDVIQSLLLSSS